MKYSEKTVSRKKVYSGTIIDVEKLKVELPNGRITNRDIVVHPGASVVLPVEDGGIYMVRQYRKAIEKVTLELPAGKLDEGESPEECALRELKEETGINAGDMQHILTIHSTPGFCNEVLHMFLATELSSGDSECDEDEFLTCERHKIDELVRMVFDGRITDAKTVIGILAAFHKGFQIK